MLTERKVRSFHIQLRTCSGFYNTRFEANHPSALKSYEEYIYTHEKSAVADLSFEVRLIKSGDLIFGYCSKAAHCWLLFNFHSLDIQLLCRAARSEFVSKFAHLSEIAPTQVQHLVLGLADTHFVHVDPLLKLKVQNKC